MSCLQVSEEGAFGTAMRWEYAQLLPQEKFLHREERKMFMKQEEVVEETTSQF